MFDLYKAFNKSLKPGTPEWMEIWRSHPELQDKMVEFTKDKSILCREEVVYTFKCHKCKERCL